MTEGTMTEGTVAADSSADFSTVLWGGVRVPITLLGGPLGSGKTTLLNRLLASADGRRLVVLVNDVGAIAVDATLIASVADDVVELTNGCVCCSMTDGLGEALEDLRQRPEPADQVIVELSGVAEPHRVIPWASTPGFRLDGVVVCVDAEQIERQLMDRWMADTVQHQLRAADLLVLTKTDLTATTPSLSHLTQAPMIDAATMSIEALLGVEAQSHITETDSADPEAQAWSQPSDGSASSADRRDAREAGTPWVVAARSSPTTIDVDGLRSRFDEIPDTVIRLKGHVVDPDGMIHLVQGVGSRRTVVASTVSIDRSQCGLVAIATPDLAVSEVEAVIDRLLGLR